MPHNPIIRQTKLGTTRPDIGQTQRGVLDDGRQYRALPRDLGRADLWAWRNQTLTVVDCSWHPWKWQVSLPSRNGGPAGEWEIELAYRVVNAPVCVSRQVTDLESALRRALRPTLEDVSGRYRLPEYERTAAALLEAIRADGAWAHYGLEVDSEVKVTPQLSEKHRQDIDEETALDAATRRPRAYVRSAQLKTADPIYTFDAVVYLSVLIDKRDEFRSLADLDASVETLWNGKVKRALARVSRDYTYHQLARADAALDQALETGDFDAYGLTVVEASAEVSLGATAAEAARADDKLRRELDNDKKRQAHYRNLALQDRASLVAIALGRGDMSLREALSYFDDIDLRRYQLPMDTLDKLKRLDVLGPDEQEAAARMILGQSLSISPNQSMVHNQERLTLRDVFQMMDGAEFPEPPLKLTDSAPDTAGAEPPDGDGDGDAA